ncbi:MAG: histidine phosphatase family protein [Motiliproteus sp.]
MKTLYLIRHAKSSWDNPQLDDHDRPLNNRGFKSIAIIAERIAEYDWHAQKLASSTALRAMTTATGLAEAIAGGQPAAAESELYTFSQEGLKRYLQKQPDSISCIALVGHNPAMEMLLDYLTEDRQLSKFPTCAIARLELDINRWDELDLGCGVLDEFEYPKKSK